MALISCPECSKGISDKAPACPHCGFPNPGGHDRTASQEAAAVMTTGAAAVQSEAAAPVESSQAGTQFPWKALLFIAAIILAAVWYFNSPGYKKQFKPEMPVKVGYRNALTGPGMVLIVENQSDRYLTLFATLKNPTLNNSRNYRLDIQPNGKAEAGYREGWPLASGDQIELTHADYRDWKGSIP